MKRFFKERADRPQEEHGIVGHRDLDCLDRIEVHRRVVVLGCVRAVGVAELPGRIGIDELEGSLRKRRCRRKLRVS
jgi:hypothetical protein